MNRTRDEFVERWKKHVAGMALFGVSSESKDGPLKRASKVLDIPDEVEKLLGKMYDDLAIDIKPLSIKQQDPKPQTRKA